MAPPRAVRTDVREPSWHRGKHSVSPPTPPLGVVLVGCGLWAMPGAVCVDGAGCVAVWLDVLYHFLRYWLVTGSRIISEFIRIVTGEKTDSGMTFYSF